MADGGTNGDFTTGELQFASWWVQNRLLLRRLGYGSLIAISALLWGYVLWSLLDAYAISYPRESRFTRQIAINQQLLSAIQTDQPQNVSMTDVSVYHTSDNRYDMAVEMTNPNPQWWAEFNYSYNISGEMTPVRTGYVLPNSTQVLTELGYAPKSAGGGSANIVIENVRWHRTDPTFVGASYDAFAKDRFQLSAQNISYDTNLVIGSKAVGQSSFTLVNESAYGFWDVDLVLRLYRGGSVVAINRITVEKVLPGEHRYLRVVWLDNLPGITKTEVIPQVNLLDPNVYLPSGYLK